MFRKCIPAIALLLLTTACRTTSLQPVAIDETDMCDYCRMAISEKRYAAEALDRDGTAYKFDNPVCMARFVTAHKLQPRIAAYYVADYETRGWLNAQRAVFVQSPAIPSPMVSGLAAFGDGGPARELASPIQGKMIRFEDLWTSLQ